MNPKSQLIKRLDTLEEKIREDSGGTVTATKEEALSAENPSESTEGSDEA